eukprot:IDg16461t1
MMMKFATAIKRTGASEPTVRTGTDANDVDSPRLQWKIPVCSSAMSLHYLRNDVFEVQVIHVRPCKDHNSLLALRDKEIGKRNHLHSC